MKGSSTRCVRRNRAPSPGGGASTPSPTRWKRSGVGAGQALRQRALGGHVEADRADRAQDPARPLQLGERLVVEARDQERALGRDQRALPGGAEAVRDERVPVPVALGAQVRVEVVRVDRFPDEVLFLERRERPAEGEAPLEPPVPLGIARPDLEAAHDEAVLLGHAVRVVIGPGRGVVARAGREDLDGDAPVPERPRRRAALGLGAARDVPPVPGGDEGEGVRQRGAPGSREGARSPRASCTRPRRRPGPGRRAGGAARRPRGGGRAPPRTRRSRRRRGRPRH